MCVWHNLVAALSSHRFIFLLSDVIKLNQKRMTMTMTAITTTTTTTQKEKKEKPQWGEGKKEKKIKASPPAVEFVNTTPKGSKKDLASIPMEEKYHPTAVESAWQEWWEARRFYSCDASWAATKPKDEKFVMVIPPPNVTGSLHLGKSLYMKKWSKKNHTRRCK